jgi:hypothetical protein
MRKRRRLPPDTRLNWRDPNMPVYMNSNSRGMILCTPEFAQEISRKRMAYIPAPDWRSDPTYDLANRRKDQPK